MGHLSSVMGLFFLDLTRFYTTFPGSSLPSAFVLCGMRELPAFVETDRQEQWLTIAFIDDDDSVAADPQPSTADGSMQIQVHELSCDFYSCLTITFLCLPIFLIYRTISLHFMAPKKNGKELCLVGLSTLTNASFFLSLN